MEDQQNHIDEIIGKYLTGQASASELSQLKDWEALSMDNARYLKDMQRIFAEAGGLNQWQQFDTDMAWRNLKNKLQQPKAKQVEMRPNFQTWLRVAAAFLILAVASIVFYQIRQNDKPEILYASSSERLVKQDTLPDGTRAFLNKNSEIRFSQTKRSGKRIVELNGEAFFEVAEKEEQDFIVQAGELLIEDIGTAFNVKAFEDSSIFKVYVESGEVRLFTENSSGIILKAGESGQYNRTDSTFTKISIEANVIAYRDRKFNFNNTPLNEVVNVLNATYEANIRLQGNGLGSCRLFVQFIDEDIETIIAIIAETLQLTVKKENHEIILQGKGCDI